MVVKMTLDSRILIGKSDDCIRLVQGCPCYREFGDESVCVNNDDILPISSISVDPNFFVSLASHTDLTEFKSDREDMCYLLINLNKDDGYAYCVSRSKILTINNQAIQASDIENALQFVPISGVGDNHIICSSCLYKYLVTLTDVFAEIVTEEERNEIISSYITDVTSQIAQDLHNGLKHPKKTENLLIQDYLEELVQQKAEWTGIIHDMRSNSVEESVVTLIETYRTLSRLEAVFMFQVISIIENKHSPTSIDLLRIMSEVTQSIVQTNETIRETQIKLLNTGRITDDIRNLLMKCNEGRQRSEKQFRNLKVVLNQIAPFSGMKTDITI